MTITPMPDEEHDEDAVRAAIATLGTEYVEATPRAPAKSVGSALALIAAAAVMSGLGAAAAAAFLVVPQPAQTTVVRPAATRPTAVTPSAPLPPVVSISVPWRWHAQ
jgi:hypothetical protein